METAKTNTIKLPVENKKVIAELINKRTLLATVLGAGGALGFVKAKDVLSSGDAYEEVEVDELIDFDESDLLVDETDNASSDAELPSSEIVAETSTQHVYVDVEAPIVEVEGSTSFGQAFAAAREELGAGGIFMYKHAYYNTYYKEEWDAMHETDRDQYFADLDGNADYESVTYLDANEDVVSVSVDESVDADITLLDETGDGVVDQIIVDLDAAEVDIVVEQDHNSSSSVEQVDSTPSFDMEEGSFGALDQVPEPEIMEVDPLDMEHYAMDDTIDLSTETVDVDDQDLESVDDVVEIEEEDVDTEDVSPDDFLDELFDDNLPEVDEQDVEDEDLPDPINDADLDDWGL